MTRKKNQDLQENLHNLLTWYLSPKSLCLNGDNKHMVSLMANNLSLGYRSLRIPEIENQELIITPGHFNPEDYIHKDKAYLSPVVEMHNLAKKNLYSMLDAFIVHGSLATMDYSRGWSDFDTYLIVSKVTLENPERLIYLREELLKAHKILLTIDPLQHHGFLLCAAHDLEHYPEHFMPTAVLKEGKTFWEGPIRIKPFVDKKRYQQDFLNHVRFMRNAANAGEFRHHAYDGVYLQEHFKNAGNAMFQLKNFLEFISILPCYLLMAKGEPCYKRDSFSKFINERDERWDIVDCMTKIREEWQKREPHPYKGNKVPDWLQEMLGPDYLEQGARFAEALGEMIGIRSCTRKNMPFFFSHMPKEKRAEDYNAARTELLKYFGASSDVVSLYEYGTCAVPGISDLDIIAVLADNPACTNLAGDMEIYLPSENLSDLLDDLRVKAVSESQFKKIQLLGEIKTSLLHGKPVDAPPLTPEIKEMCTVCDVMDWLPERILTLLTIYKSRNIAVTEFLGYLKSFSITIGNLALLGFPNPKEVSKTLCNIERLRQDWFSHQNTGALLETAECAILGGFKIMQQFSDFVVSKGWIQEGSQSLESSFGIRPGQHFRFNKEGHDFSKPQFSLNMDANTIIDVPGIWLSYLMTMGTCPGPLSEVISGNIANLYEMKKPTLDERLIKVIGLRMALCNDMYDYFQKYNIPFRLLYRFGHLQMVKGAGL